MRTDGRSSNTFEPLPRALCVPLTLPPPSKHTLTHLGTDLEAAAQGQWQQRNLSSHSAADEATAAAVAVAATVAAMAPGDAPPGAHSRASFIAAATGAMTAAGVLGVRTGKLPRGVSPTAVRLMVQPEGIPSWQTRTHKGSYSFIPDQFILVRFNLRATRNTSNVACPHMPHLPVA